MTTVFFFKTTDSYEVADGSYEVCRLGHHVGSTFVGFNYRIVPD